VPRRRKRESGKRSDGYSAREKNSPFHELTARVKRTIEFHRVDTKLPAVSTIICHRTKAEIDAEVAAIHRVGVEIAKTKKSAREFLIRTGLLTKDGKRLTKRYR
jgi:hypothetical protein